jgi:predicted transcriptional regulator
MKIPFISIKYRGALIFCFLLCLFFVCLPASAKAATYYVDPSGSDSYNGTQ